MRILTFDIEDWFHILDNEGTRLETDWARFEPRIERNVDRILGLLADHDQKATFFCLGWVARRHPAVIRAIVAQGHEIGCHSDMHQLVYQQSRTAFDEDLRRALDVLQDTSGRTVRYYRAPGFSIVPGCEWAFDALAAAGIAIDCSLFPARRAHGGMPDVPLAGPARITTGAGLLKLLPMSVDRRFGFPIVYSDHFNKVNLSTLNLQDEIRTSECV